MALRRKHSRWPVAARCRRVRSLSKGCKRGALAPLELVMSLPVLLFVTALVVNIGSVVVWRVRGEVVAREAAWQVRWPRTGYRESPAAVWPSEASVAVVDLPAAAAYDPTDLHHPVVRGTLPNGFAVYPALVPGRGLGQGMASIKHAYPLLPRMGEYSSGEIRHPLLDERWSCGAMEMTNFFPRSLNLYDLPNTDRSHPQTLRNAILTLLRMPRRKDLAVLDADREIEEIKGRKVDFHPRIDHPYPPEQLVNVDLCLTDPGVVRRDHVDRLVDVFDEEGHAVLREISLLPRTLTNAFLKIYEDEIIRLEKSIQDWENKLRRFPPPSMQEQYRLRKLIREATARISRLQRHIAPLQAYKKRLPEIERKLREQVELKGV